MKPLRHLRLLSVALATLTLAGLARATDEDTSVARVKFSDPTKPGTLKLLLPWADVTVTGTDSDEIVVRSSLPERGKAQTRSDGLRRLDEEITFELIEKNNTASLSLIGDSVAHGAEFTVEVPRQTCLTLRTQAGGDIAINGVEGDLDINSMNGEITLTDISSSAVVNTMNGEINATFKRAPVKPVSLSSMNGEIFVKLPADTKANLRLRSHNGAILTDFSDDALKAKSERTPTKGRRSSYTYSTGQNIEAREAARAAAAVAAEVARAGLEIAREVSREVSRDVARAMSEADREVRAAQREIERSSNEADEIGRNDRESSTPKASRAPKAAAEVAEAPEPAEAPLPPLPPVPASGGKSVVGTLNGGGIDITIATMNGTITLRKAK